MQKQLYTKLIIIAVVAGLVLFCISLVNYKLIEREGYLLDAQQGVADSWTRPQTLVSPVLVFPYTIKTEPVHKNSLPTIETRYEYLYPRSLETTTEVDNSRLRKGIYEVPIYFSEIEIQAMFTASQTRDVLRGLTQKKGYIRQKQPYLSLHVSDMRGIDQLPLVFINQKKQPVQVGSALPHLDSGIHVELNNLAAETDLQIDVRLSLKGMSHFSLVPIADEASMQMVSNWAHPAFIGAALPKEREVSKSGFVASWYTTHYSNNYKAQLLSCLRGKSCQTLFDSALGVNFIEPINVYVKSERSLKYAMLFVGLSFVIFFLFENVKGILIHPFQYLLVGLSIATFYLLLLSLAEHIAFHWAYIIGVLACVSLLWLYLKHMLKGVMAASIFCAVLTAVYAILYVIIQAEDFALLMGAMLVFVLLSALMLMTRKMDWYALHVERKVETEVLQTDDKISDDV